jgi:hypothetical protein
VFRCLEEFCVRHLEETVVGNERHPQHGNRLHWHCSAARKAVSMVCAGSAIRDSTVRLLYWRQASPTRTAILLVYTLCNTEALADRSKFSHCRRYGKRQTFTSIYKHIYNYNNILQSSRQALVPECFDLVSSKIDIDDI